MAASRTTLKKGDNLPARGKAFKTLLFEVMREESLLGLPECATRDQAEKAFISHAAERAFNASDPASNTVLSEFLKRTFPPLKQTQEAVSFEFPVDGTPTQKAMAVVEAISNGSIPADMGQTIISIIKDAVLIEESTDLKARIEELEKALGLANG